MMCAAPTARRSGQIDDEAVFYLRARGIPEAEARALLVQAFIGEIIDRFPDASVRAWAADRVNAWLEAGALDGAHAS